MFFFCFEKKKLNTNFLFLLSSPFLLLHSQSRNVTLVSLDTEIFV